VRLSYTAFRLEAPVHACRIVANVAAATDQRLIAVEVPADVGARARVPGQWVLCGAPGGPHAMFVLSSPVGRTERWEILIRQGAKVADALARLPPSCSVEVSVPQGTGFPMDRILEEEREVVLACAGAGIAAVRPVLHAILQARGTLDRVRLYHGVATRAHAAFADEVTDLRRSGLHARLCLSREEPDALGAKGHVQDVLRSEGRPLTGAAVVVAGPAAFVKEMRAGLAPVGLAPGAVITNY
jgi:NAD(P)H-flavin reductase